VEHKYVPDRIQGPFGFTLIELVLVIAVLGILAVAALPLLFNTTNDAARRAGLNATVSGIQTALAAYAASQLTQGNNISYPSTLDNVTSPATASGLTPFFRNVLSSGVGTQWFKVSDSCYVYDLNGNGTLDSGGDSYFLYDNVAGRFTQVTSCS